MTGLRRPLLAAIAVLALVAAVALASRAHVPAGHQGPSRRVDGSVVIDAFFVLAVMLGLATLVMLAFVRGASRRGQPRSLLQELRTLGVIMTVVLAAVLLASRMRNSGIFQNGSAGRFRPFGAARPPDSRTPAAAADQPWTPGWPAIVAAAIVGALFFVVLVRVLRERLARRAAEDEGLEASLVRALDASLASLELEPDPRQAVIAAYARMEKVLAAHGLGRQAAEAPGEYLRRVLASLEVSGDAARRLTALFELARFSTHEIRPPMRGEAFEALRAVRDELLPAPA